MTAQQGTNEPGANPVLRAPRAALLTAAVLLNLSLCSLCPLPRGDRQPSSPTPKATAAGQPAAIQLAATYQDADGFWTIRYPQDWQQQVRGSETQFQADGSGQTGVAVSVQTKATSAAGLAADVSALLAGRVAGYAVADQRETTIDGYAGVEVLHTYQQGGTPVEGFMIVLVRNRVGVLILGYAPRDRYPEIQTVLRAIADSIEVTEFDVAPPYAQWDVYRGEHLTFVTLPDTYAATAVADIAAAHERAFQENVDRLGADPQGVIDFYLYPSAEALYRATARRSGFAIAEQNEVHTLWAAVDDHQSLGHEMSHVIAHGLWGEPAEALLGEGLAVCLDHAAPHPHDRAATWLAQDRLFPLSNMLGEAWFDLDPEVAYPESGSVACWLLDRYGIDRFRQLYTSEDLQTALVQVCGLDLSALEQEWLQDLEKR